MMDGTRISVPLRPSNISGKKMRKRRELDALVASNGLKRYSGYSGPVCVKPGTNYHDQLLSESTDEQEDYWKTRTKSNNKRSRPSIFKRRDVSVISLCITTFVIASLLISGALIWLFFDLRDQTYYLDNELKRGRSEWIKNWLILYSRGIESHLPWEVIVCIKRSHVFCPWSNE